MRMEFTFSAPNIPTHEELAAAYLAVIEVITGKTLSTTPVVRRINEEYGFRQEERYDYGSVHCGLHAHAVGLMSGHGRHGTKTTWRGQGMPLTGSSQRYGLGRSYAQVEVVGLDAGVEKKARKAFYEALADEDVRARADGAAIGAVDRAVNDWKTGTDWPRAALVEVLRETLGSTAPHSPPGAAARFLLARLLLLGGAHDEAADLLDTLAEAGESLEFCRGLACGLAADGSLWYVYRPSKTPPPRPWMEVQLARGWVSERRGSPGEAVQRYRSILSTEAILSGGIRPDSEARAQLQRLSAQPEG